MMTDLEAKLYIAQVRTFYQDLMGYGVVNGALILIWLFSSHSWHFWPGWVLLGWGILLLKRAFDLRLISPKKLDILPFLAADWEEKQLQKLTGGAVLPAAEETPDPKKPKAS